MQSLGLSDSTPRTQSRLRVLFWPSVDSDVDADDVSRNGFYVCAAVALLTAVVGVFTAGPLVLIDCVFFFIAGLGIRQYSRFAAVAAFVVYLAGSAVHFNVLRLLFLALLVAAVRGTFLVARWRKRPEGFTPAPRVVETLADRFSERMPELLWPWARWVFYVLTVLEVLGVAMIVAAAIAGASV